MPKDNSNITRKGEVKQFRWMKVRHTLEDDFRTPQFLFDSIAAKYGPFQLDVCASEENHLCENWFSEKEQSWNSKRVWCNPPYHSSKKLPKFLVLNSKIKK
jgi:phage N-6-adenine-methyltransferase